MTGTEIAIRAHAKINVFLRILERRADGFHDIESLLLPVSLHDLVVVRPAERLSVVVTGDRASALTETTAENLVLLAARAIADAAGLAGAGAEIRVDKRIPVAAGLGGGSADAAATLRALNHLWGCGLDDAGLARVGVRVGSDVPGFLADDAVFVSGRGERVDPVHVAATTWVLAPQPFQVLASRAYGWWDEDGVTGPDPGALIAAAETGNAPVLGSALFDDLQAPVARRHPEVSATVSAFLRAGALGAVMSGSGPTVAALASDPVLADRLADAVPGSIVVSAPPASRGAAAG